MVGDSWPAWYNEVIKTMLKSLSKANNTQYEIKSRKFFLNSSNKIILHRKQIFHYSEINVVCLMEFFVITFQVFF